MTALLVSFGSNSEPCLSFSAFVGGPVAGLVVDASFGDFIRRAPRALPNRPRQSVGRLRRLFQRDPLIFPPEVAGFERPGSTSRVANRTNAAGGCDRYAPRRRPDRPPVWRARTTIRSAGEQTQETHPLDIPKILSENSAVILVHTEVTAGWGAPGASRSTSYTVRRKARDHSCPTGGSIGRDTSRHTSA